MRWVLEIVDEVDSTNRVLLERARAGAAEGAVLVARHQTAGRGRLDRRWEAPPGASLLVSVLLRPALAVARAHLLTVAAALAAADACEAVAGVAPALKWPNDLVVDVEGESRKLAGLLAESIVEHGGLVAVVVGMGLNVNWPVPPRSGGTALNLLAGRAVDADALLERWVAGFQARYGTLANPGGADSLTVEHRARCSTVGRDVTVLLPQREVAGRAVDVDADGQLVVDIGGRLERYAVGDVIHARVSAGP